MAKSSTQSQSSNKSGGVKKQIAKKSASKKTPPSKTYTKAAMEKMKKALDNDRKTATHTFWEDQFKSGKSLLKVNAKIGKLEKQCREDLALCYRIAAKEGLNEGTDNHFSLMLNVDGYQGMLTLPHGIMWETTKPGDFILVDMDGTILRPSARKDKPGFGSIYVPDLSAIKIHGKIHAGLGPDRAMAVFHTHQPYTSILAACKPGDDELQMVHQNCCRFYNSTIYYREFNGIVNNDTEGMNLMKFFQKKGHDEARVMMLRNHGIITIGSSAASAMMDMYYFERCARMQVELAKMGQNIKRDCVIADPLANGVYEYVEKREIERFSNNLLQAWRNAGI